MSLYKQAEGHLSDCTNRTSCYLWLTLDKVPAATAIRANETFDGRGEIFTSRHRKITMG